MAVAEPSGLTPQQRRALDARGVNVALSAGAGCGKTFVLTERFLAAAAQTGASGLGRVVAITFTDRAAREMRGRIRAACRERLLSCDLEEAEHWRSLDRELESARISTIHSFCTSLLRSHSVEAGLDPRFQTLEDAHSATLLSGLIDDQLRQLLAVRNPAAMELAVIFGIDRLHELIGRALAIRRELDYDVWKRETAESLVERWDRFHRERVLPALARRLAEHHSVKGVLAVLGEVGHGELRNALIQERRRTLLELLPRLGSGEHGLADLDAIHEAARVEHAGGAKAWPSEESYATFRDCSTQLRTKIDAARKCREFDRQAALPSAAAACALMEVAGPIAEAYRKEKQELSVLDFDDLLIHARDLVHGKDKALSRRIAESIDMLLVDESQDTNPLQIELIKALCGRDLFDAKLFVVGDYKQSIYRFTGADPSVFRRLRKDVPEAGRLPLTRNFRSQPAILNFVNALFSDALGPDYEPLEPDRRQIGPTPAVEFLWAPAEDPEARAWLNQTRRREADWIARRVRAMLDDPEPIVGDKAADLGQPTCRRVLPGDIVLLFRALNDVPVYEEALRRQGIDYYLVGGKAFYAQQEVFDLLNLLRALASPSDEISLAGVLRSPFFCLADETLYWLAQHPGRLPGGLADADLPPQLDAEQARRARFAAETLAALRNVKDRLPVAELIHEALSRTAYDASLLAEFLGERKLANLHKLIDQARGFDRSGMFTLADFITQLTEFVAEQPAEPLAAINPESTDVVRLMTIHQSKGLEFPVVFVTDLARYGHPTWNSFAFHPDLGPAVKLPSDDESGDPGGVELFRRFEAAEEEAELLRLFYVATTRAADYLVLSSAVKFLGDASGPWMRLLGERFDLRTGEARIPLPAGVDNRLARVTESEPPTAGLAPGRRPQSAGHIADRLREAIVAGGSPPEQSVAAIGPDRAARRQFSFSRLTGALKKAAPPIELLRDVAAPAVEGSDPLRLGTLVHDVLAVAPLGKPFDARATAERLARRRGETSAVEVDDAVELVARFNRSPLAARLASSRCIHREMEFLLAWPLDGPRAGGLFLQGFIDCLYQDAGGEWHLLDYKTNRVKKGQIASSAAAYEMQMLVYSLALERTLGRPPATASLYFLRADELYTFTYDAAARRRIMDDVNRGIAALVMDFDDLAAPAARRHEHERLEVSR